MNDEQVKALIENEQGKTAEWERQREKLQERLRIAEQQRDCWKAALEFEMGSSSVERWEKEINEPCQFFVGKGAADRLMVGRDAEKFNVHLDLSDLISKGASLRCDSAQRDKEDRQ